MSGKPHDADVTIDMSSGAQGTPWHAQFEAAWDQALRGGVPPDVESFLARTPEAERTALLDELTRIDAEYRRRHAQLCSLAAAAVLTADATVAPAADSVVSVTGPTVTV